MKTLVFKEFVKELKLSFFEKYNFAKYINSLGMGSYNKVIWTKENWMDYYQKFKNLDWKALVI